MLWRYRSVKVVRSSLSEVAVGMDTPSIGRDLAGI